MHICSLKNLSSIPENKLRHKTNTQINPLELSLLLVTYHFDTLLIPSVQNHLWLHYTAISTYHFHTLPIPSVQGHLCLHYTATSRSLGLPETGIRLQLQG